MEEPVIERQELSPISRVPILETETSVSYLGTRLPKAERSDSPFVPKKEAYADYIDDKFSLEMQRNLATAFSMGQPILIEGGTEIGKTTTARKMAAELGWEVHYANLNHGADETKLMGKPMPNTKRTSPEDPEYVYWLGKVSAGLVPEEGKIKLIIIDEIGAAMPENLIMLHEILDAIGRGEPVDLSEFGNGIVRIDPDKIKIAAFTNPPGKGYIGRQQLDQAQLRRWVYYKAPSELPKETAARFSKAIFGLAPQTEEMLDDDVYLFSRDQVLLPEQLPEIPGIGEILEKYDEFHEAAKALLKERQIAADQPQQFTFGDRSERIRIRSFLLNFYRGDANETFKKALRFYYSNKLESDVDRAKLEELIAHVEYIAPIQNTQRIPIEATPVAIAPRVSEATPSSATTVEARREQDEWRKALGVNVETKPIPSSVDSLTTKEKLADFGLELLYLPKLDIGTLADLKRLGVEAFLDELQRRYPNWKHYEKMTAAEQADHSKSRNLNEWYWDLVKDGKVNFPKLPGQWVAIEKMPKPKYGDQYEHTKMGERLGYPNRFSVSWNDAKNSIAREGAAFIASSVFARDGHLRMPTALEWNLIANRKGWGATNTYEWTDDEYRDSGGSDRLVVGYSDDGGAAFAGWDRPDGQHDRLGFRVAVVIDP